MKLTHSINQVIKWNLEKYIIRIVKKYLDDIILNSTMRTYRIDYAHITKS